MSHKEVPFAEPNDPVVVVPPQPLPRIPRLTAGMLPTRHYPSCESGMLAPGTRHSAECRKSKLSSCLILSIRCLRIWSKLLTLEVEVSPKPLFVLHELHVSELA